MQFFTYDFLRLVCKVTFINMCILEGVFSGNLSLDMSEESTWRIRRYGFCGMRSKKVHTFP
jgi:hypothetical protein